VDVSSEQAAQHIAEVFRVLNEIGAAGTPQILVMNKADRLSPTVQDGVLGPRLLADAGQSPATPFALVSGLTGEGLPRLLELIDKVIPFDALETVQFRIPVRDGSAIALLHNCGKVLREDYDGSLCLIEAEAPESLRRRLRRYMVRSSIVAPVENSVHK
jgi:GTP-binding protein HflX